MSKQIAFNGTSGSDEINTGDLQKYYPNHVWGFEVEGKAGNDVLTSSFIGRNGVDFIDGGEGDDILGLYPSYLSPRSVTNYVTYFGGFGTDVVVIPSMEFHRRSLFSIDESGGIHFDVFSSHGDNTSVSLGPTVESITIGDLTYLTEDIYKGRIRSVGWDEQYFRTYNDNSDWYVKGLDTYSKYHYPNTTSATTSPTSTTNSGEWTGNTFFNLKNPGNISGITKQWFGSGEAETTKSEIIDIEGNPQLLDVSTKTWNRKVKINKIIQASNKGDTIKAESPEKFVAAVGSVLNGGSSGDVVEGRIGWDIIDGGAGSDFIHGGNGRDVIAGGAGGDELWGDFGLNTFESEKDGSKDLIVIKSDHYVYNWLNDNYTNNPNGERTDFIEGLDSWDRIRVTGGYKQDLRFAENVTHMGQTGIAIYLKDSLEALYTGNDLSLDQIKNMTDGDGSGAAIANAVHQYGLDWL